MFALLPILVSVVLWLAALSTGERWAFASAFLVLVGVIGETVTDLFEWIKDEDVSKWVEKASALVLILGLTGDLIAISITQREIAELTKEASDAKTSAENAASAALVAKTSSEEARTVSVEAATQI